MSKFTVEELNRDTLVGMTDQLGKFWTWRAGADNHFPGPVPKERVCDLLDFVPLVVPHTYPFNGETRTSDRVDIVHPTTGNLLGVFKDGYQPHPYRSTLVDKVETITGGDLIIESAGMLGGGRVGFVEIGLPETIRIDSVGEAIRPKLLAASSLDGTVKTRFRRVITRVGCDNTLSTAIAELTDMEVAVKHTNGSLDRLNIIETRNTLGIMFQMADEFTKAIETLTATTVTNKQWTDFLDLHLGDRPADKGRSQTIHDNHRDALVKLYKTDERVAPWAGTEWGVLQAVNTYNQHLATVRGTERPFRVLSDTIKTDRKGLSEVDKRDTETMRQIELVLAN